MAKLSDRNVFSPQAQKKQHDDGLAQNVLRMLRYNYRRLTRPSVIGMAGIKVAARESPITSQIRRSLYKERYERWELDLLERVLAPGDKLLDIGAGIGVTSIYSALIVGERNVTAVEANPNLSKAFKKNCELNNIDIYLVNCILSPLENDEKQVDFFIDNHFWSSSTLKTKGDRIKVDVLPIQNILNTGITVINADIEGAEADLFGCLAEFKCVQKILIETHTRYVGSTRLNKMLQNLLKNGFIFDFTLSSRERIFLFR